MTLTRDVTATLTVTEPKRLPAAPRYVPDPAPRPETTDQLHRHGTLPNHPGLRRIPASSGTGGHGGIGGKLSGFLYSLAGILNWEILLFRPAVEPLGLPEKNLRIWNVSSNNFYIAIITDI